jgi:hypothetical protein
MLLTRASRHASRATIDHVPTARITPSRLVRTKNLISVLTSIEYVLGVLHAIYHLPFVAKEFPLVIARGSGPERETTR